MKVALECRETGSLMELPVGDWRSSATQSEIDVLAGVRPAVIDIGCGPGRVAHALSARGIPALGIDASPSAVLHARHFGAPAIERSIFEPLPAEGRWGTAILFDGNIGIGGDPVALLRRVASVVAPGALVLVEVGAPGTQTDARQVRVAVEGEAPGPWFCWARVSADAIDHLAQSVSLDLLAVEQVDGRFFAWLQSTRSATPIADGPGRSDCPEQPVDLPTVAVRRRALGRL